MDSFFSSCFYTVIASALLILICRYYLGKRCSTAKSKRPPEPAGKWPIIGHLPLLAGSQLFHKIFGSMADNCGPIFTLQLGVNSTLVVSSWELAQELFTTNDLAVASRPPLISSKHVYNFAVLSLAPHGPYWREIRKIAILELLSNKRIELQKHVMIHEVKKSIKELYKLWDGKRNGLGAHFVVDLSQWFSDLTINVILSFVAGNKCSGSSDGVVADETARKRWREAIKEVLHYFGMFFVRDALPFLGWLDIGGHEKGIKRAAKKLDSVCQELLEEHKQGRVLGGSKDEQDFIDVMLSVLGDKKLAGFDADTAIKATCFTMVAGGSDTTMVTLIWAVSLLLNNPHSLAQAKEEIERCVGKERLVNDADISSLVYLQAIVKETLRLYPPGPLGITHQFTEDCTVDGYHVPKGTWLLVNIWKIHRDPSVWPNPLEFKPERFLNREVDEKGKCYEFIPFGSGRRACPGQSFAFKLMHLTLATLIQAFEISNSSNEPVDMTETPAIVNMKSTPLEVLVSPRLPPQLYA